MAPRESSTNLPQNCATAGFDGPPSCWILCVLRHYVHTCWTLELFTISVFEGSTSIKRKIPRRKFMYKDKNTVLWCVGWRRRFSVGHRITFVWLALGKYWGSWPEKTRWSLHSAFTDNYCHFGWVITYSSLFFVHSQHFIYLRRTWATRSIVLLFLTLPTIFNCRHYSYWVTV